MSEAIKANLRSPSGDSIEVEWTGERLLVFMTSPDGSVLEIYDSVAAAVIEKEHLAEEGTLLAP